MLCSIGPILIRSEGKQRHCFDSAIQMMFESENASGSRNASEVGIMKRRLYLRDAVSNFIEHIRLGGKDDVGDADLRVD